MRQRFRDQRGAALVLTVLFLFSIILIAGMALDFGRAYLLRAQLQTALDAAVLAGALQAEPWVEITVPRWYWTRVPEYCEDPETGERYECGWHWRRRRVDVVLEGTEAALLWRQEYLEEFCAWPYTCEEPIINREWIVLDESAVDWARQAFARNADWPDGRGGANLRELQIGTDPAQARVTARGALSLPTSLLRLVGVSELTVHRTAGAEPVRRER